MKDLSFPENITLEKEIAPGILRKDLKKLIGIAIPGTVIGIIVWSFGANQPLIQLVALIAVLLNLFVCYVVMARIDGSMSIYNYLALLIRFHREQQRFYYKQPKEVLYRVGTTRSQETGSAGVHQC